MPVFCENEGRRLFLYHLAQVFFHENTKDFDVFCELKDGFATVTLRRGEEEAKATRPVKVSLHREERRAENAALGLAFTDAAKHFTPYTPPYGSLIGVRPVKVPLYYFSLGLDEKEITSLLQEEFSVREDKAQLLMDLAKKEKAFAESLSPDDALLYISIPFCPSRCTYCSFISSAAPEHLALLPDYVSLLLNEIRAMADLFREKGKVLKAIYMGGGTPGILSPSQMEEVLLCIKEEFDLSRSLEFCVELGRPDTVTEEKLALLSRCGVGRISINPQTTCDETLCRIGRKHSAKDFFDAFRLAKKYPFQINCDLISALPGETPEVFTKSVRDILSLDPDNVTIHALCRKKSATDKEEKEFDSSFSESVGDAHRTCINAGLFPYYLYRQKMTDSDLENLGFAKEGAIGIYNLAMMEDLCDVFACGAGAISKIVPKKKGEKILRFAGFKYPFEYLSHPEKIFENIEEMKRL